MQIGPWFILTYTLRALGGLCLGVAWVWVAGLRQGMLPRQLSVLLWTAALGAVVGGRGGYVAQHAAYFAQHPGDVGWLWRVGGLDGPGAWIGGLTATAFLAWRARYPLRQALEVLAPAALLLSAGVWWGCSDVGCAWGREVAGSVPSWQRWMVREGPDLYRALAPRYAVQLLAAGGGAVLAGAAALSPRRSVGIAALYLAGLAALTLLRADPVPMLGSMRLDMALYGALALAGGVLAGLSTFLREGG